MNRTRVRIVVVAVFAGVFVASLTSVFTAPQSTPVASAPVAQTGSPGTSAAQAPAALRGGETRPAAPAPVELGTINQYCVGCHNDRAKMGGVSFQGITAASIAEHAELYEKAVKKMRGRVMPPPGARQPEPAAADAVVAFLEQSLDRAAGQAHLRDKVVLHRLNRKEYAHAVRDLLAVEFDAAEVLPADDVSGGFDNIADALQVSPSFVEQYVIAARAVAVKALGRGDARPGGWTFRAGAGNQLTHVPGLPLGTRGGILAEVDLPADGEYIVDIADIVTHIWGNGMEFENPIVVTLDNKVVYETVIGGEEDMKLYDQVQSGALDRANARLKNIRFQATAGPHRIGATFKRRTFAESDDQLQQFSPGGGQDRLYRISSFQLRGPFDAKGLSTTPSRDRIFTCRPAPVRPGSGGQAAAATTEVQAPASAKASAGSRRSSPESDASEVGCARKIIATLAKRAYRRPVTDVDVNELMQYYQDGAKDGFEAGIRSALTGLLASPFFLYRAEVLPAGVKAGAPYALGDVELASKLSFFLWNSIPDDELLQLAIDGKLKDAAVLDRQVKRLLADPRSITLAGNFLHQWLDMKRLDEIVPDTAVFPYASFRSDPRDDFRTELTLFADSVFREDRSVVDLLSARHTFLNERVALHYGITDVKGARFRRVELSDSPRWGLLGKGAVLMAAAYPNRTSPVLRGAFVLKHIVGVPPANPPMEVPTLDEKDIGTTKALTVREMIAKHRASPQCASCHAVMDPLGLALENFDATGMWRDRDRHAGQAIDASGVLPDGTKVNGPDDLRTALLRRPEQFAQTFVEGLLTYATGRAPQHTDMPTVRRIVRAAAANDYRFSTIVQAVVKSDQFRMRRAPQPQPRGERARAN
jgi:mono/diheme cytochrome c family protein